MQHKLPPSKLAAQMFGALTQHAKLDADKAREVMDILHDEFGAGAFWDDVDHDRDIVAYDDLIEAFDTRRLPT